IVLAPGDPVRVSFWGSPQAAAEFSIQDVARHVPMGERLAANNSTDTARGFYEGPYIIQPLDKANQAAINVVLKGQGKQIRAKAKGRLTIDTGAVPKTGLIVDDVAAVRTGPEGGYDIFLYKGMRVALTGKIK